MVKKDISKMNAPLNKMADELDIVEFYLGQQCYGVNIMQVSEIIRASVGIIPVSDAAPSVSGVVNLRGKIIPVINLPLHFGEAVSDEDKANRIIVFRNRHMHVGFFVDRVTGIQRIPLSEMNPPSDLVQSKGHYTIGLIKIDDRVLFLLDLEKIALDIRPGGEETEEDGESVEIVSVDFDRSKKKVIIVEDSPFVRKLVVGHVKKAGYNVIVVNNGFEAWQILEGTTQLPDFTDIADYYQLVITDIEMPQMDGLQLIQNIRQHPDLEKLPCLIFSSLITEEMSKKCVEVGANGQVSKPELARLIHLVDSNVIK